MDDLLLERFLHGDPLLIRQLRPIILDYVVKTGGVPDDAREAFQIVSLSLLERSRRRPDQYLGKVFKTWLNKQHRRDPSYAGERADRLTAALLSAFAAYPDLKTGLRKKEKAAMDHYKRRGGEILQPLVLAEGGDVAVVETLLDKALEKIQHSILDFKDYFLKSCKNEWLHIKKRRGMLSPEEELTHLAAEDEEESQAIAQKNLVLNLLQKVSKLCNTLLHHLIIEGKTKEESMILLGYTNPDSFDVAKSRCMSALRTAVKENPHFKPADA